MKTYVCDGMSDNIRTMINQAQVFNSYYNETESHSWFHYLNQQNTIKSDRVSHYGLRFNKTVGEINRILIFHHEDNSIIKRLLLTK